MLKARWWSWWKENIKITRTHSKFYKNGQKLFWKRWTRMRTEMEKGNYFRNLAHGAGQQTRNLQIYVRISRGTQRLMECHAILVFLNVFFESASLCQNPGVYAGAGSQPRILQLKTLSHFSCCQHGHTSFWEAERNFTSLDILTVIADIKKIIPTGK